MIIVGIDPGSARIGVSLVINGVPVEWDTLTSQTALLTWIRAHKPDVVVIEDFILMGEDSHLNKESIATIKLIGRVIGWCDLLKIKVVLQPNRCKDMGEKLTGMSTKKSVKANDAHSAVNHAVFYFHSQSRSPVAGGKPPKPKQPWKHV